MHVIPAKGRQVPDPETGGFLPPDGRQVEASQFWLRRIADGDVTVQKDSPTDKAAPAAEKEH